MNTHNMTHRDLMRRVILLCSSFARNLAFYRVGQEDAFGLLLLPSHPAASFWRQANSNFLDVAVLEWCKLFGDKKGKHCWSRTASDSVAFKSGLLEHVQMSGTNFDKYIAEMRGYRDKFVAHLDHDHTMQIPMLDTAHASVSFYHAHLVTKEVQPGELAGLRVDTQDKFRLGYEQCIAEAKATLSSALNELAPPAP